MKKNSFYISTHGFGHATRTTEVINWIAKMQPGHTTYVHTGVPKWLFEQNIKGAFIYHEVVLDVGVIEKDALRQEPLFTLQAAAKLLESTDALISSEASFIASEQISLIVTDIPFLAVDIAKTVGIPCLAIGNFSWDWIYSPYIEQFTEYAYIVDRIKTSYAQTDMLLRLPLNAGMDVFPRCVDVPLVVRRSEADESEILDALGIPDVEKRRKIFWCFTRNVPSSLLVKGAQNSPDYLFLAFDELEGHNPGNIVEIPEHFRGRFLDILKAADAVISKLGYGITADCTGNKTRLMHIPREGFVEYEVIKNGVNRYIPAYEIPEYDFETGRWQQHLDALLEMPYVQTDNELDGARRCAELVLSILRN